MAFQVSPGVLVQELDLTRVIPAVSTSIGAFAGEFRQGPVDEIVTVSSEQQLTEQFGKPDANNFEDYLSKFWLVKPKAASLGQLLSNTRARPE